MWRMCLRNTLKNVLKILVMVPERNLRNVIGLHRLLLLVLDLETKRRNLSQNPDQSQNLAVLNAAKTDLVDLDQ